MDRIHVSVWTDNSGDVRVRIILCNCFNIRFSDWREGLMASSVTCDRYRLCSYDRI